MERTCYCGAPRVEDAGRELVFDAWRMVVPKKLSSLSDDELQKGY